MITNQARYLRVIFSSYISSYCKSKLSSRQIFFELCYHGMGKKLSDILPNNLSFAFTILAGSSSFALPSPPRKEVSESDSDESESNTANLSSSLFSMDANSSPIASKMSL
mmetsp:Transcript_23970/g.51743  ORF Transcript_23970/g.51743 Transcript_23970/m.51743 type:complete len:110 (-) Transcript_23970:8786-9115(-)